MNSLTTTSAMPKELEKKVVDRWKFDLLGIQPALMKIENLRCHLCGLSKTYKGKLAVHCTCH
jgi:hypothetical protein